MSLTLASLDVLPHQLLHHLRTHIVCYSPYWGRQHITNGLRRYCLPQPLVLLLQLGDPRLRFLQLALATLELSEALQS